MSDSAQPEVLAARKGSVADRTYALTELVGTSKVGVDDAIRNAVTRASKTIDHLDWFEVSQIRGYIRGGDVDHFQVTIKVGSRLEDV
jgi:flavin-binding protein dodecin